MMVAGAASPIRISTGTSVHMNSSLVLWLQVAAIAPFDLRNRNMAMNITPNTMMPRATHTQKAAMCRSQMWFESGVTPASRFTCHGRGFAAAAIDNSRPAKASVAPWIRRLQLLELIVIAHPARLESVLLVRFIIVTRLPFAKAAEKPRVCTRRFGARWLRKHDHVVRACNDKQSTPSTITPAAVAGQQVPQPPRQLHPFVVPETLPYFLGTTMRGEHHMPVAVTAFQYPHPCPCRGKRARGTAPRWHLLDADLVRVERDAFPAVPVAPHQPERDRHHRDHEQREQWREHVAPPRCHCRDEQGRDAQFPHHPANLATIQRPVRCQQQRHLPGANNSRKTCDHGHLRYRNPGIIRRPAQHGKNRRAPGHGMCRASLAVRRTQRTMGGHVAALSDARNHQSRIAPAAGPRACADHRVLAARRNRSRQ